MSSREGCKERFILGTGSKRRRRHCLWRIKKKKTRIKLNANLLFMLVLG